MHTRPKNQHLKQIRKSKLNITINEFKNNIQSIYHNYLVQEHTNLKRTQNLKRTSILNYNILKFLDHKDINYKTMQLLKN